MTDRHDENESQRMEWDKLNHELLYLREENHLLKEVIDNLPGSVYWKDRRGVYLGNNKYAKKQMEILGYTATDPTGKTDYDLFSKETADIYVKNDRDVFLHGKELVREEQYTLSNGKTLTRLSSKKPLYNTEGNIIGLVGNTVDITHLKEIEDRLKHAKEQAELANHAKTEFIRNISHDMRTPLIGAISGIEILVRRLSVDNDRALGAEIIKSLEHLLTMMNEIIDVSQYDSGDRDIVKSEFSIAGICVKLQELFMPALHDKNLKFMISGVSEIPPSVIGDEKKIFRILVNLLGNAIKFTQHGSITLSVQVDETIENKILVSFSLQDTGVGIAEDKLEEIFKPFEKLASSYQQQQYEGAGLGLFYVKQSVALLRGKVFVQSTVGVGSTFTCVIPLEVSMDEENLDENTTDLEVKNLEPEEERTPHPLHVLLVEDTYLPRVAAQDLLLHLHYEVSLAESLKEAFVQLTAHRFDIIFIDIGLPDGSGIDIIKTLKNDPNHLNHSTEIVVLTAHLDKEIAEACGSMGVNHIFDKPLSMNKLDRVVSLLKLVPKQEPTVDLASLSALFGGNHALAKDMVKMLFDEMPVFRQQLNAAYTTNDLAALKAHVHKLHGALCYAGDVNFRASAKNLEEAIKSGQSLDGPFSKLIHEMSLFDEWCRSNLTL